jgi:alkanesulfonate monooxygenase SsuD/methylene tetrahydromethanopterin reductase-like flavin-dependent oxidoreductase (luciferase family)
VLTRLGLVVSGVASSGPSDPQSFGRISELVAVAETSGFDSIWVPDSPTAIRSGEDPLFEAYTLLGALAARTRSARLGAFVTPVTRRAPALLAKQVTTLDMLSSGRAVLGVGAGRQDPHDVDRGELSVALTERFERLEEALQVFRAMFTQDPVRFEGRYYQLNDAVNRPRPLRDGGPPILIGGNGDRTLRLVAEYADACNLTGDLSTIRGKIRALERHCAASGRDPSSITKTVLVTLVIAPSASAAIERVGELRMRKLDDFIASTVIAGDSDEVSRQVADVLDLGIDGLIVDMPDCHDTELVALAGEALSRSF